MSRLIMLFMARRTFNSGEFKTSAAAGLVREQGYLPPRRPPASGSISRSIRDWVVVVRRRRSTPGRSLTSNSVRRTGAAPASRTTAPHGAARRCRTALFARNSREVRLRPRATRPSFPSSCSATCLAFHGERLLAWRDRPPSPTRPSAASVFTEQIREVHEEASVHGSPRVHPWNCARGVDCCRNTGQVDAAAGREFVPRPDALRRPHHRQAVTID